MTTPRRKPGRPAKPMFPQLTPREAASEGAVSVRVAREKYLGGIGQAKFYELVNAGEIEIVHEGRRTVVPVRQLIE